MSLKVYESTHAKFCSSWFYMLTTKITTAVAQTDVPKNEQRSFNQDVIDHTAYSPNAAPFDFHTFPGLHNFLGGQWFHGKKRLKKIATNFFEKKDPVWYATGINELIDRYKTCHARHGDYVEKYVIT